jgi:hypothetical protein
MKSFVIESVLEHMKNRDDQIEEMRKALESLEIFQCSECSKYEIGTFDCDFCSYQCCKNCYYNLRPFKYVEKPKAIRNVLSAIISDFIPTQSSARRLIKICKNCRKN